MRMRWMGAASASSTPGLAAGFIAVAICAATGGPAGGGQGSRSVAKQGGLAGGPQAHRTAAAGGVMGAAWPPPASPCCCCCCHCRPIQYTAAGHPGGRSSSPPRSVHGKAKPPLLSPHRVPESALSVSLSLREEGVAGGAPPSSGREMQGPGRRWASPGLPRRLFLVLCVVTGPSSVRPGSQAARPRGVTPRPPFELPLLPTMADQAAAAEAPKREAGAGRS